MLGLRKRNNHRISSRCSIYPPHPHKEATNPPFPWPEEKQLLHIKASAVKYLSKCLSPLPWMPGFPDSSLTDLLFTFPSTKWNFFITAANYKAGKFFEGSLRQTGSPPSPGIGEGAAGAALGADTGGKELQEVIAGSWSWSCFSLSPFCFLGCHRYASLRATQGQGGRAGASQGWWD